MAIGSCLFVPNAHCFDVVYLSGCSKSTVGARRHASLKGIDRHLVAVFAFPTWVLSRATPWETLLMLWRRVASLGRLNRDRAEQDQKLCPLGMVQGTKAIQRQMELKCLDHGI